MPLRNQLWNCINKHYFNNLPSYVHSGEPVCTLLLTLWTDYYELRTDEIEQYPLSTVYKIKNEFLGQDWGVMYDILEFIPNHFLHQAINNRFKFNANEVLERYLSAYRFAGDVIVDITSEEELKSIEGAIKDTSKYKTVQSHLNRALELFADRHTPDYRNSIKEAISAVEALCSIITGKPKATLGQALAEIEKTHQLHSALKESFSKLYGWTSDASGIRHKLLEESTLGQEDATLC